MIFLGSTVDNVLVLDSLWNYRSKVCPVLVSWTVQIIECLLSLAEPGTVLSVWRLVSWWSDSPWRGQRRHEMLRDSHPEMEDSRQSSWDGGQCREASELDHGWVVEDGEGYLTYRGMRRGRRQWTFSCPMMTSGCWEELAARKTRSAAPWRGWELWELRGR